MVCFYAIVTFSDRIELLTCIKKLLIRVESRHRLLSLAGFNLIYFNTSQNCTFSWKLVYILFPLKDPNRFCQLFPVCTCERLCVFPPARFILFAYTHESTAQLDIYATTAYACSYVYNVLLHCTQGYSWLQGSTIRLGVIVTTSTQSHWLKLSMVQPWLWQLASNNEDAYMIYNFCYVYVIVIITWAQGIRLIYMYMPEGQRARAYISGKSQVPML